MSILFSLFICGLANFGLASKNPMAEGHIDALAGLGLLRGVMIWEIPPDETKASFVLYPNKYVAGARTLGTANRELLEGFGADLGNFEIAQLKSHGSLVIDKVELSTPEPPENSYQNFAPVSFELKYAETELVVTFPETSYGKVKKLRISFSTYPPFNKGNFGFAEKNRFILSGPIFPLSRSRIYDHRISFSGGQVFCVRCYDQGGQAEEKKRDEHSQKILPNKKSYLKFLGFPPPLYFNETKMPLTIRDFSGFKLLFFGNESELLAEKISALVKKFVAGIPKLNVQRESSSKREIGIATHVLGKNLVLRQSGEVQLGKGFFKVSPIFEKYHEAAFLRALVHEIVHGMLLEEMRPSKVTENNSLDTTAGMIAEVQISLWYSSLNELQKFSESLSFIPFFNDILKGKALLNNDVFLGIEERSNPLDTAALSEIFPKLTGRQAIERLRWCHGENAIVTFAQNVHTFLAGGINGAAVYNNLVNLGPGKCKEPFSEILAQKTASEVILVKETPSQTGNREIGFSRKSVLETSRDPLGFRSEHPIYDTLKFEVAAPAEGLIVNSSDLEGANSHAPIQNQKAHVISYSGDQTVNFPVSSSMEPYAAKVYGPNNAINKDEQELPRQIDFLLTGLKLRYDSRQGSIDGQQGVEWRFRGDPLNRNLGVLLRKQQNLYFLDSSFSFVAFREQSQTTSSKDNLYPAVLQVPDRFPFSLGLSSELNGNPKVWGFASLGASALTSSTLVPSGFESELTLRQSIFRKDQKPHSHRIEVKGSIYIPVARLTTFVTNLRLGLSNEAVELGGASYLPGTKPNILVASRYAAFRQEIKYVFAQNLKWDMLRSFLFEDALLYVAHCALFDTEKYHIRDPKIVSLQSIVLGTQLLGAFFGAKDQSVALEVARPLDNEPRSVFSLTIGRNF